MKITCCLLCGRPVVGARLCYPCSAALELLLVRAAILIMAVFVFALVVVTVGR